MKDLSVPTRVYIAGTLAAGAGAFLWAVSRPLEGAPDLAAFAVFTVAAAIAQLFNVVTLRNHAYSTTPAFLFGAVLLLDEPALAICTVVAFLPEWVKRRYPWFMAAFNISAHLVQVLAARAVLRAAAPGAITGGSENVLGVALAALVFGVGNHAMLALVLLLARRVPPRASGLFQFDSLITEIGLMSLGAGMAVLWKVSPWLFLVGASPVLLLHRSLSVPRLKEEASVDPKTGLYNMNRFREAFAEELRRAARFGRPLSVIMADLDLLRNINNTYGHLAGDAVLQGLARIIKSQVREYDVAARFGGEEFAILLPETDAERARALAERIRRQVEATSFEVPTSTTPIRATLSLGIATYPGHATTPESLLQAADLAVYWSKLNGRNRTQVASSEVAQAAASLMAGHAPGWEPIETRAIFGGRRGQTGQRPAESPAQPSVPGEAERPAERVDRLTTLLIGLVAGGGAIALGVALLTAGPLDPVGLGVFALLAGLAELIALNVYQRQRISLSFVAILAAGLLWGPPAGAVAAVCAALAAGLVTRSRAERIAFNVGTLVLAAVAGAVVFRAVARLPAAAPTSLELVPLVAGAVAAAVANYGLNAGLLAVAIARTQRASVRRVYHEHFSWLLPHYVVLGLVALAVAVAYQTFGLAGVAVFLAPSLGMRLAMRQFLDRTVENVRELRQLSEQLQATLAEQEERYDRLLGAMLAGASPALSERAEEVRMLCQRLGRALGLHPDLRRALGDLAFLRLVAALMLHERRGSGPVQLPGVPPRAALEIAAQIFAVAETYVGLLAGGEEEPALDPARALQAIQAESEFDPRVVAALVTVQASDGPIDEELAA